MSGYYDNYLYTPMGLVPPEHVAHILTERLGCAQKHQEVLDLAKFKS
jgi:hypothetical protein